MLGDTNITKKFKELQFTIGKLLLIWYGLFHAQKQTYARGKKTSASIQRILPPPMDSIVGIGIGSNLP